MSTIIQPESRQTSTAPLTTNPVSLVDRMPFIGAAAAGTGFVGGTFFGAIGFLAGFAMGTIIALVAPDYPKRT